jgi:hypothetical protein
VVYLGHHYTSGEAKSIPEKFGLGAYLNQHFTNNGTVCTVKQDGRPYRVQMITFTEKLKNLKYANFKAFITYGMGPQLKFLPTFFFLLVG